VGNLERGVGNGPIPGQPPEVISIGKFKGPQKKALAMKVRLPPHGTGAGFLWSDFIGQILS
jgi:hypothetical protein